MERSRWLLKHVLNFALQLYFYSDGLCARQHWIACGVHRVVDSQDHEAFPQPCERLREELLVAVFFLKKNSSDPCSWLNLYRCCGFGLPIENPGVTFFHFRGHRVSVSLVWACGHWPESVLLWFFSPSSHTRLPDHPLRVHEVRLDTWATEAVVVWPPA